MRSASCALARREPLQPVRHVEPLAREGRARVDALALHNERLDAAPALAAPGAVEEAVGDRPAHVGLGLLDLEAVAQAAERGRQGVLHHVAGLLLVTGQEHRVAHERLAALRHQLGDDQLPPGCHASSPTL